MIRIATLSDAKALASFAERSFRAAFAQQNTRENMDLHCRASFGEHIQAAELVARNTLTFLAEEQGALIAYVQLRLHHSNPSLPASVAGEIRRLYVDPAWHGQGLAQDMMQHAIQTFADQGMETIWLGVWEQNPRAIAFYQKFGFEEVGEQTFLLGKDAQRDLLMARAI